MLAAIGAILTGIACGRTQGALWAPLWGYERGSFFDVCVGAVAQGGASGRELQQGGLWSARGQGLGRITRLAGGRELVRRGELVRKWGTERRLEPRQAVLPSAGCSCAGKAVGHSPGPGRARWPTPVLEGKGFDACGGQPNIAGLVTWLWI